MSLLATLTVVVNHDNAECAFQAPMVFLVRRHTVGTRCLIREGCGPTHTRPTCSFFVPRQLHSQYRSSGQHEMSNISVHKAALNRMYMQTLLDIVVANAHKNTIDCRTVWFGAVADFTGPETRGCHRRCAKVFPPSCMRFACLSF